MGSGRAAAATAGAPFFALAGQPSAPWADDFNFLAAVACVRVFGALPGPPHRRRVPLHPCQRTGRAAASSRSPSWLARPRACTAIASANGVFSVLASSASLSVCELVVIEPDGGVQRRHLDGVHPGLSRDLRGTRAWSARPSSGRRRPAPRPGPARVPARTRQVRSIGVLPNAAAPRRPLHVSPVRLRPAPTRPPPASTRPNVKPADIADIES